MTVMLTTERQNTISAVSKCAAPSFTQTPISAKHSPAASIQRDCMAGGGWRAGRRRVNASQLAADRGPAVVRSTRRAMLRALPGYSPQSKRTRRSARSNASAVAAASS